MVILKKQHKNPIYNIIVHENAVNFNTIAKIFHILLKILTSGGDYAIMTAQNSILREGVAGVFSRNKPTYWLGNRSCGFGVGSAVF